MLGLLIKDLWHGTSEKHNTTLAVKACLFETGSDYFCRADCTCVHACLSTDQSPTELHPHSSQFYTLPLHICTSSSAAKCYTADVETEQLSPADLI